MIQLESIEHDYVRGLKSQSYNQMSTWNESVGLRARGYERPKFYSTGGNTEFLCFHVVNSLMPILALLVISSSL